MRTVLLKSSVQVRRCTHQNSHVYPVFRTDKISISFVFNASRGDVFRHDMSLFSFPFDDSAKESLVGLVVTIVNKN